MSTTKTKTQQPEPHLTLMQSLFVDAYLGQAHGNATLACRIAGYKCTSESGLRSVACQNLRKPSIAKRIQQRQAELAQNTEVDPAWCLREAKKGYERCKGEDGEKGDESNANAYFDKACRMVGAYEADNRQRQPQLGVFIT